MGRADTVWSSISTIRVDAVTSHTGPHVRVSVLGEPVHIRRRNGPERGRDGRDSEMSTGSQLAGRKLFGNPTPQSVPSPARRRIGPKRETASRGHSWYRSGRAAPGAVPGECLRRPRDLQWEGLPARTIVETRFCMGSPPQSRYSSPSSPNSPTIVGGDNGDFATVGASGRSRGRFLATLEGRLPGPVAA